MRAHTGTVNCGITRCLYASKSATGRGDNGIACEHEFMALTSFEESSLNPDSAALGSDGAAHEESEL